MRRLADLGFIGVKPGPLGDLSYAVIYNPYHVIKRAYLAGQVHENEWQALVIRANEVSAFARGDGLSRGVRGPAGAQDLEGPHAAACQLRLHRGRPGPWAISSYAVIYNPYHVIKRAYLAGQVHENKWQALVIRANEVSASTSTTSTTRARSSSGRTGRMTTRTPSRHPPSRGPQAARRPRLRDPISRDRHPRADRRSDHRDHEELKPTTTAPIWRQRSCIKSSRNTRARGSVARS